MTDNELLERAATAAGYQWRADVAQQRGFEHVLGLWIPGLTTLWNPLADDGDALRMAVKLKLSIMLGDADDVDSVVQVSANDDGEFCIAFAMEKPGADPAAAVRRAIVRAAAAMAEARNLPLPNAEVRRAQRPETT